MIQTILNILKALFGYSKSHEQFAKENLVLRQQIIVQRRTVRKTILRDLDRNLFAWLSQICQTCNDALIKVKPETMIKWHNGSK